MVPFRPDDCCTSPSLGREAIATGLAYGRERFAPRAFRVTVASFNVRVRRVVTALGFAPVDRFEASTDGQLYDVLVRIS